MLFVGRAPGGGRGHQGEHCVLARVTPTVLANAHSDAFKMIDPPIQACKVQHLTKGVALRMAEAEAVSPGCPGCPWASKEQLSVIVRATIAARDRRMRLMAERFGQRWAEEIAAAEHRGGVCGVVKYYHILY